MQKESVGEQSYESLVLHTLQHSVSYELSAACITVKLLAYSIRDDIRKIPMDCGKFHMNSLLATFYFAPV